MIKTEIYAENGVPEYWIVNLRADTVEVLTCPTATGYQRRVKKRTGDLLRPLNLRGVRLEVADVPWLPRKDSRAKPRKKVRTKPRRRPTVANRRARRR